MVDAENCLRLEWGRGIHQMNDLTLWKDITRIIRWHFRLEVNKIYSCSCSYRTWVNENISTVHSLWMNKWQNLPVRVIAVEFVYSIKTRRRFHGHAKRTYRVLARFTSLLFAMRTSTIATAHKDETMLTSTHILTLSSLRWKGLHFLLSRINKLNRDFFHWQLFSLVCPLKNHVTLLLSHQSLSACKDGGHRELSLLRKEE